MDDLAKRLVAHERWRWMEGMKFDPRADGWPEIMVCDGCRGEGVPMPWDFKRKGDPVPVLTDPATQGCLLAMLVEAQESDIAKVHIDHWTDQEVSVEWFDEKTKMHPDVKVGSLGEALAAALLEVWGA